MILTFDIEPQAKQSVSFGNGHAYTKSKKRTIKKLYV